MKAISKFAVRGLLLLLLAGGIAAVGFKQSAVARLRAEQQVLVSESQEARELAAENEGIAKLREENVEVVRLREENKDLPRLRNEARQLRRETEESGKLRAENERLQATISAGKRSGTTAHELPADFVARAAMGDVGLGTPEAAVQTAFWAMCQGNVERVAQCFVDGGPNLDRDVERQRTEMMEGMKSFPGFRIGEKKMISADEVELGMQSSPGGPAAPVKLKLVGSEWKIQH